jgi:uncharacterized protein YndB with AHSA1/START domain
MLNLIVIVVVVLIAVVLIVLIVAATKSNVFRVQRSTSIKASPEKIFPLINDFHSWPSWSPYEKLDPAMQRAHSGAASGKGAKYAWEGNNKAGAGRMEITDTSPPSSITIDLEFNRPFKSHYTTVYTFEPHGDTTNVTWAMQGPSPFMTKVMSVFLDMDNLIGKDFELGLAALKAISEK